MLTFLLGGLAMATPQQDIGAVLDRLHQAATDADERVYFDCYTADAVFVGTDATERWTMAEFRTFAHPHFAEAPAWAYTPVTREVHLGPSGDVAWFYETLTHARYGKVRGSGTLRREGTDWKVAQYVLSFPIPNDKAKAVIELVEPAVVEPAPGG